MNISDALEPLVAQEHLENPLIVAGAHAYLIGSQDGSFPDMGWHETGEMGGLWAHPIKLLDGFWLRAGDAWLEAAHRLRLGPYWAEHEYDLGELRVVRYAFVPDTETAVVVRYSFSASSARSVPVRFLARTDLRGVWPPEKGETEDAPDVPSYLTDLGAWSCRSEAKAGYVVLGARDRTPTRHAEGRELWGPQITAGHGISVALDYDLQVNAGEAAELEFVITGSHQSSALALAAYRRVCGQVPTLRHTKNQRYRDMLGYSALEIPEPSIERAWNWVKCDYDWLVREVQPWGRGLGAGVADYPWWFGCDNGYALRGCLALGQHDIAIDTLDLLRRLSETANGDSGRVIHEANTRGTATDRGRTEETPHFIRAVWDTFQWTGDLSFLERNYPFCKQGLLHWTLGQQCRGDDPLPYGYGVMEMAGLDLQCVDTAALTIEALQALGSMADILDDGRVAARCRELYGPARARLEEAFWMETDGIYGDMVATPAEMAPRLRAWLGEARDNPSAAQSFEHLLQEAETAPDQDRKRPWLLKNWSVLCPLEGRLASPSRALRTLRRAEGPEFTGPWGLYICGTYRTAMMSIGTGVMAAAEAEYDRPEQALRYIRMMTDTLDMHMPGAISEMSPDWGCFVQAWSGYGVAWPVVAGIFGIRPDAFRRRVELAPSFPAGWSRAQLSAVRVGTNRLGLRWDGGVLWVTSRETGWDITCDRLPMRLVPGSGPPAAD